MGKLGCAWSSSVKICDYLCKRLLITARMDKRKNGKKKRIDGGMLIVALYCTVKGVNSTQKKTKKLVWFIVFY